MHTNMASSNNNTRYKVSLLEDGTLFLELMHNWHIKEGLETIKKIEEKIHSIKATQPITKLSFRTKFIEQWDTSLILFLKRVTKLCKKENIQVDLDSLPNGLRNILLLSSKHPIESNQPPPKRPNLLFKIGSLTIDLFSQIGELFAFVGEVTTSLANLLRRKSYMRRKDLSYLVEQVGADALPIVALISFLVGIILAFVGAIQLEKFGASIYVADLVGLATVREMAPMMTGVIMCGRTGAAFAATIGSMKINEEIDALTITGINPIDFVVLPRILSLTLMMPLLVIFANIIGITGGLLITVSITDVSVLEYYRKTQTALAIDDFLVGLSKSLVFGALVSLAGCLKGLRAEQNASGIGVATTAAVVTGITSLIIADALFAFLLNALGI